MGSKSYVVSTKKATTKYHSDEHHHRFGIQNWLCNKRYILENPDNIDNAYRVDGDKYRELLKEFALSENPNFDFNVPKNLIKSLENFVQNRFSKFCIFCNKKFNPKD